MVHSLDGIDGRTTPGGLRGTTLRRLQTGLADGPAADADQAAICSLTDLWLKARGVV